MSNSVTVSMLEGELPPTIHPCVLHPNGIKNTSNQKPSLAPILSFERFFRLGASERVRIDVLKLPR